MTYYFAHVPLEAATIPATGETVVDNWRIVHPEKGLAIYRRTGDPSYTASQCNRDENVTRYIQPRLHPDSEVEQVPLVFMSSVMKWLRENDQA